MLYNKRMEQVFSYSTTAQIDARLYNDILAREERIEKICIIAYIILLIIFRGWIGYWLKFGLAIPKQIDYKPININAEPIQINYTPEQQKEKTFTYRTLQDNKEIELIPQAHYIINGKVLSYQYDISNNQIRFFDSAALYDLALSWGKLSDKTLFNDYFECYNQKNKVTGSRLFWLEPKAFEPPFSNDYVKTHWSQSNIIPANRNIMAALLKLKHWNLVQIEGDLVDLKYNRPGKFALTHATSLSRADDNSTICRGNGPGEVIYVTKIKIGNFVYQ